MLGSLSKKITSLVIAASSLFSSHVTPIFENCTYRLQDDVLIFTGQLSNCYNKDIEQIMQSGQRILLEFTYSIHEQGNNIPLHVNSETHVITYDVVDRVYTIDFTENGESIIYLDFLEAKRHFVQLEELAIQHIDFFEEGRRYFFEITATLKPVYLEEMENNIELMKYWNNSPPSYSSPSFSLRELES